MSWAVNSKSSVGILSVTGRILRPVTGKGPTEPIIGENASRPVTEKLPLNILRLQPVNAKYYIFHMTETFTPKQPYAFISHKHNI